MEFLTLVSLIHFCSVVCKNLTCTWCFLLIFVRTMKNKHVRNLSLTCEIDYDLNFSIFYFNLSSARVSSTIIVDIYFPFIIFKYLSVFRPKVSSQDPYSIWEHMVVYSVVLFKVQKSIIFYSIVVSIEELLKLARLWKVETKKFRKLQFF